MAQYIDKDALVAEIERLYEEHSSKEYRDEAALVLEDLEDFLDTLDVKEVDFEKAFDEYTLPIVAQDIREEPFTSLAKCAKHFFELGMRLNNPITAADRGMAEEIIINLKRVEKDYRINLAKEMEWLRNKVKKG